MSKRHPGAKPKRLSTRKGWATKADFDDLATAVGALMPLLLDWQRENLDQIKYARNLAHGADSRALSLERLFQVTEAHHAFIKLATQRLEDIEAELKAARTLWAAHAPVAP